MVPFIAIFSFFLFSFTGAFYFALRGEEHTTTVVTASNCSSEIDDEMFIQNFTTVELSSLDIYPHLTEYGIFVCVCVCVHVCMHVRACVYACARVTSICYK